jgi:hypothetical protein
MHLIKVSNCLLLEAEVTFWFNTPNGATAPSAG